jgi:hypothetical protein
VIETKQAINTEICPAFFTFFYILPHPDNTLQTVVAIIIISAIIPAIIPAIQITSSTIRILHALPLR